MLVLSRCVGERVLIGDNIAIVALEGRPGKVRLGIEAPASVRVDREEVRERIDRQSTSTPGGSLKPAQ